MPRRSATCARATMPTATMQRENDDDDTETREEEEGTPDMSRGRKCGRERKKKPTHFTGNAYTFLRQLEKENNSLRPSDERKRERRSAVFVCRGAFLCAILKSPPRKQIFHQDCSSALQASDSCIICILFSDCNCDINIFRRMRLSYANV